MCPQLLGLHVNTITLSDLLNFSEPQLSVLQKEITQSLCVPVATQAHPLSSSSPDTCGVIILNTFKNTTLIFYRFSLTPIVENYVFQRQSPKVYVSSPTLETGWVSVTISTVVQKDCHYKATAEMLRQIPPPLLEFLSRP